MWMSHVTYNESCYVWMSGAPFICCHSHVGVSMKESCRMWMCHVTCEWVTSRMNVSCYVWMSAFMCYFSHAGVSMNESCRLWRLIHMWPDSLICDMIYGSWHVYNSFIYDLTHWYVTWSIGYGTCMTESFWVTCCCYVYRWAIYGVTEHACLTWLSHIESWAAVVVYVCAMDESWHV